MKVVICSLQWGRRLDVSLLADSHPYSAPSRSDVLDLVAAAHSGGLNNSHNNNNSHHHGSLLSAVQASIAVATAPPAIGPYAFMTRTVSNTITTKSSSSRPHHQLVLVFDPQRNVSLMQLLRVCHAVADTLAVDCSTEVSRSPLVLALKSWYTASQSFSPHRRTSAVVDRYLRTVCRSVELEPSIWPSLVPASALVGSGHTALSPAMAIVPTASPSTPDIIGSTVRSRGFQGAASASTDYRAIDLYRMVVPFDAPQRYAVDASSASWQRPLSPTPPPPPPASDPPLVQDAVQVVLPSELIPTPPTAQMDRAADDGAEEDNVRLSTLRDEEASTNLGDAEVHSDSRDLVGEVLAMEDSLGSFELFDAAAMEGSRKGRYQHDTQKNDQGAPQQEEEEDKGADADLLPDTDESPLPFSDFRIVVRETIDADAHHQPSKVPEMLFTGSIHLEPASPTEGGYCDIEWSRSEPTSADNSSTAGWGDWQEVELHFQWPYSPLPPSSSSSTNETSWSGGPTLTLMEGIINEPRGGTVMRLTGNESLRVSVWVRTRRRTHNTTGLEEQQQQPSVTESASRLLLLGEYCLQSISVPLEVYRHHNLYSLWCPVQLSGRWKLGVQRRPKTSVTLSVDSLFPHQQPSGNNNDEMEGDTELEISHSLRCAVRVSPDAVDELIDPIILMVRPFLEDPTDLLLTVAVPLLDVVKHKRNRGAACGWYVTPSVEGVTVAAKFAKRVPSGSTTEGEQRELERAKSVVKQHQTVYVQFEGVGGLRSGLTIEARCATRQVPLELSYSAKHYKFSQL